MHYFGPVSCKVAKLIALIQTAHDVYFVSTYKRHHFMNSIEFLLITQMNQSRAFNIHTGYIFI